MRDDTARAIAVVIRRAAVTLHVLPAVERLAQHIVDRWGPPRRGQP